MYLHLCFVIIYSDGVGDGQLSMCKEYEIPQLKQACSLEKPDYNPLFTFIVVQKRINTRLFAVSILYINCVVYELKFINFYIFDGYIDWPRWLRKSKSWYSY